MNPQMIGVLGAGLMGVGIALQYARKGYGVVLYDPFPEQLARVGATAADVFQELSAAGCASADDCREALARLQPVSELERLRAVSVVIEAVPEKVELKRRLYAELERVIDRSAIVGSNTSGLMPDELAADMAHPERFLIAHFWNPPHVIPLVELVPGSRTDRRHVEALDAQLRAIDMQPVVLRKAIPGFVGNRIQFAVLREALNILRSGAADAHEIDLVVQATLGRRYSFVGPLAGADLGGLGTFATIAAHLMPELAKDEEVIDLLRAHADRGETGERSGRGFHEWDTARREAVRQRRRALLTQLAGRRESEL